MTAGTIYSQPDYADIDVGLQMRFGHPYVAEGDAIIVEKVRRLAKSRRHPLRVFEVGSGSGYLVEKLNAAVPDAEFVANEMEPALAALARRRFAGGPVKVFDRAFQDWKEPVDVLISWGAHHHIASKNHLAHARSLIEPEGVLILGDEFCPDYLDDDARARVEQADIIYNADGHVLTQQSEVASFLAEGTVPEWSKALEARRQRALWTWYKYVVDHAIEVHDDIVVQAELRIAADDLRTDFAGEHKLCLPIVARDLELNGFVECDRIAMEERPELASFFILELLAG